MEKCSHLRPRDDNAYGYDVEKIIKSIEYKYKVDIRTVHEWKGLVDRLHHANTDYKRILQASKNRKKLIVQKILDQTTRLSPFQITEYMLRTRDKWEYMKRKRKSRISYSQFMPELIPVQTYPENEGEMSIEDLKAHPNSEIALDENFKEKIDTDTGTAPFEPTGDSPRLPPYICVNQHKRISLLGSKDSYLRNVVPVQDNNITETDIQEWCSIKKCPLVRSYPPEIIVERMTSTRQTFTFSVVNIGTEYKNLRFMSIIDPTPFNYSQILPNTPVRLVPGISVGFKFIFDLHENVDDIYSHLYFRVGRNVIFSSPCESLVIPIRKVSLERIIPIVPKIVTLPPAYPWHINGKVGYPKGIIKLINKCSFSYHVHIDKRTPDFSQEYVKSLMSVNAYSPNTESIQDRIEDNQQIEDNHNKLIAIEDDVQLAESLITLDMIFLILDEIVENALATFVIARSYVVVKPYSTALVEVYFTKYEHIGLHQCYYDIEFCDSETDKSLMTKSVQVHAEVLNHPVVISPSFLDISSGNVRYGFIKERIMFYNNDTTYPVTVKIKLTKKMKKLFTVTPMQIVLNRRSSGFAFIRFCSSDFMRETKADDLAYFIIKILFEGHKSIYYNSPPVFYEIVAPCASEFKKLYNDKYFKEVSDESSLLVTHQDKIN